MQNNDRKMYEKELLKELSSREYQYGRSDDHRRSSLSRVPKPKSKLVKIKTLIIRWNVQWLRSRTDELLQLVKDYSSSIIIIKSTRNQINLIYN